MKKGELKFGWKDCRYLFQGEFNMHRSHCILGLVWYNLFEKFHLHFIGLLLAAPHTFEVQAVFLELKKKVAVTYIKKFRIQKLIRI
jgi:hypothetical protein